MQFQQTSDRLTVIYLLDQSLSIPKRGVPAMIRYVNASIREQRQDAKERPGRRDRVRPQRRSRSAAGRLRHSAHAAASKVCSTPSSRNLSGAMQRAMAMFPHDAAKRIVLVTDGNQNVGDALEEARAIADAGVSIDVMPVPLDQQSEVSVERVALPADVRRDQPFELRVVLNNAATGDPRRPSRCSGRVAHRAQGRRSRGNAGR